MSLTSYSFAIPADLRVTGSDHQGKTAEGDEGGDRQGRQFDAEVDHLLVLGFVALIEP